MHRVRGTKNTTPKLGPEEDWSSGRGRQRGVAGVRLREGLIGSKGPRYGRTLGPTGTW